MHVMVDARQREGAERWTARQAEDWVQASAMHTGLHIIHGPIVKMYDDSIHAFALIGESHIKGEFDLIQRKCWLDCFSCKWFSSPEWVDLSAQRLELDRDTMITHMIGRSL